MDSRGVFKQIAVKNQNDHSKPLELFWDFL